MPKARLTDAPAYRLKRSQIADLKLAASHMKGPSRRAFEAAMALKYCEGDANLAEKIFGWNRQTVILGLNEVRTGIICLNAHAARCGTKLWEDRHPEVADVLWGLAEAHAQTDPTFQSTHSFTRLTAAEALRQLREHGFSEDQLPSASCMAEVLNRNGYRLRPVVKAKPKKKSLKRTPSSQTSTKRMSKAERARNA